LSSTFYISDFFSLAWTFKFKARRSAKVPRNTWFNKPLPLIMSGLRAFNSNLIAI
jgi:hypothetical protein